MKKAGMPRAAILCIVIAFVVGIVALAFLAPIVAAVLFVFLAAVTAIFVGRKEGGWRGFVAFAKDMIFGW